MTVTLRGVILALLVLVILLFIVLPLIGMALWAFITTVIVGLVIGGLGRLVVPGPQPIGFIATVLAGLCGSIVGGFLGQHVFHVGHLLTIVVEIAVSAVVVAILTGGRRATAR